MNVYDQIVDNDNKTVFILISFPAALFVTVFLFSLLFVKVDSLILSLEAILCAKLRPPHQPMDVTLAIYPWMVLVASLWIVFSYYKGNWMILRIANARPVTFDENRELFRLVENTAIMAGLPTPQIYLIEDESMNAFATGRKPEEASIALTSGIVKKLDKAELQTVIAHELAHIGNHDTRLMLMVIAGIGCFIFFGQLLCRMAFDSSNSNSKKNGKGALFIFGLGVICLVYGYLIAPLLRFALSRLREYQADATAAKITRDPEALARALLKIATDPRVEGLDASPLAGNMCIANPAEFNFISRMYSTHPPIDDRIAALLKMTVRGRALH